MESKCKDCPYDCGGYADCGINCEKLVIDPETGSPVCTAKGEFVIIEEG